MSSIVAPAAPSVGPIHADTPPATSSGGATTPTPLPDLSGAAVARKIKDAVEGNQGLQAVVDLFAGDASVSGDASSPCPCVGKTAIDAGLRGHAGASAPGVAFMIAVMVVSAREFNDPPSTLGTVTFDPQVGDDVFHVVM